MSAFKVAVSATPTIEISEVGGGKWKIVTSAVGKSKSVEFAFDTPHDEKVQRWGKWRALGCKKLLPCLPGCCLAKQVHFLAHLCV